MASIDINADLGEGGLYDDELLGIVSSCNIACGGHAGDADTMRATAQVAIKNGVAIGAHPSYPDKQGFGRRSRFQAGVELLNSLVAQIGALQDVVAGQGAAMRHIKPHGALYNDAANDTELAEIVVQAALDAGANLSIVGPPDSALQRAAESHDLRFLGEAFIDRAYLADGSLVPRTESGAVYDSLEPIVTQALSLAAKQSVTSIDGKRIAIRADTLCVHGDTPSAADAARAVCQALQEQGIEIRGDRQ